MVTRRRLRQLVAALDRLERRVTTLERHLDRRPWDCSPTVGTAPGDPGYLLSRTSPGAPPPPRGGRP